MKKLELRKEYAKPDARLITFNYKEVVMASGEESGVTEEDPTESEIDP